MREVRVLVGLSESRIRELIAAGRFPQPSYRDGPRCTRWSVGSIRQWLQDSQAAAK
jgi:predicted DNA-binding transcriptional regulator AlpA